MASQRSGDSSGGTWEGRAPGAGDSARTDTDAGRAGRGAGMGRAWRSDEARGERRSAAAPSSPWADRRKRRPQPAGTKVRHRRRWWQWAGGVLLVLVLAGVAARLYLPFWLRDYVNRTLDKSPDYDGRIGSVEVHLWRGAYSIHELDIVKTAHLVSVPFFESPKVDFSLSWRDLLHGAARGKIVMFSPKLNFVAGPTAEETQTGAGQPWLEIINELYPFRIDRAEVHDGEVHFQAPHTSPPVDVYLSEVEGLLENLTNIENKLDPLVATLSVKGRAMESGNLTIDMTFDPQSHRPSFALAVRLLDMQVTKLNSLTRAYGQFDFEVGRFDFVMEATATDGYMDGYAKPLFRGVKVIGLQDLKDGKDPLQLFWEALVGVVGEVFKNQSRDQFGTRITLEGDLENPNMNLMEIIGNVLYNAFVRAYLPRYEGTGAPNVVGTGVEKPGKTEKKK